jgi:hypothetical protein
MQVAGKLYIGDREYYLLHPRPLVKFDTWTEGYDVFFACGAGDTQGKYGGKARHLVVKGDWFIDYASAGNSIEVEVDLDLFNSMTKEEATAGYILDGKLPDWLENEFKNVESLEKGE